MAKPKYYQVDFTKTQLIVANVSHYIQQAYQIWDSLKKPGQTGDESDLFRGNDRDREVVRIAEMLRDEDHFIRRVESKTNT